MSKERRKMLQDPAEVIAMPPLKMVLVHAQEERENHTDVLAAVIKSAAPQEDVDPQDLKKIIEHLKRKDSA